MLPFGSSQTGIPSWARVFSLALLAGLVSHSLVSCSANPDADLRLVESSGFRYLNVTTPRGKSQTRNDFLRVGVDRATVSYGSTRGYRQQDTLVFIDDPSIAWENGATARLPPETTRGVGVSWSGCASAACSRDALDVHKNLRCALFKPEELCVPDRERTKAYFTYDRGACSKRTRTGPLLAGLATSATQAVYDQVEEGDPSLASTESTVVAGAVSGIWQAPESRQALGGFQVNLDFEIHTTGITWVGPCPFCLPVFVDLDAWSNVSARYEWALSDGLLGARLLSTFVHENADQNELFGVYSFPMAFTDQLVGGLKDVPEQIQAEARSQQIQEIPTPTGEPVSCTAPQDCTDPLGAAQALILGTAVIGGEEGLAPERIVDIVNLVKDEREWICDGTCKMLVRAARVNVYPSAVELVFREAGKNNYPVKRESAIEMALKLAQKGGNGDELNALCDPPPPAGERGLSSSFSRESSKRVYD